MVATQYIAKVPIWGEWHPIVNERPVNATSAAMKPLSSPSPHIQAFVEDSIGWLVLNRPERRNALNAAMWAAIPPLMKSLDEQADVRAIVLRGQGREAFAAGADISEFGRSPERRGGRGGL